MDWDDDGDRSLMEWYEEKELDRNRKRKRKSSHRSRRQSGVIPLTNITNIPPEEKNSNRRVGGKYLLVGAPKTNVSIDHPRMALLDKRIQKAALMVEEMSIIRARERKLQ